MKLVRSIDGYEKCTPRAVSDGSPAQMFYFVEDAKKDIATLVKSLRQARAWIEHFKADKAAGLMPTDTALDTAIAEIDAVLA